MKKYIVIAVSVLLLLLISAAASCASAKEGVLPTLNPGDKWVEKWTLDGSVLTATMEVTGEDITDGISCYIVKYTFEPPNQGVIDTAMARYNKADLSLVKLEFSAETNEGPISSVSTYTYDAAEPAIYPFTVGKEFREVQYITQSITRSGQTQTETDKKITVSKIEKMEDITVAAGTFRCFKILKYDEQGNLLTTSWHSDKVKTMRVKSIDAKTGGDEYELISYSVK